MELTSLPGAESLRKVVAAAVQAPFEPAREGVLETIYRNPPGDPGLLAGASPAMDVHADLPAMMVGGLGALFLQTLHPGAMAGVAEHSNYREDPYGRLRRTAQFIAVTTYGNSVEAEKMLARIRGAHGRVRGYRPDGVPYSAEDPKLLRWVHVTEVRTFLAASMVFGPRTFTAQERDRYYADVAPIAERLGATEVPRSEAEVERYLEGVRPELYCGEQAREAVRFLLRGMPRSRGESAAVALLGRCAAAVVPQWAAKMLSLPHPTGLERELLVRSSRSLFEVVRWALPPHPLRIAARERQGSAPLRAEGSAYPSSSTR